MGTAITLVFTSVLAVSLIYLIEYNSDKITRKNKKTDEQLKEKKTKKEEDENKEKESKKLGAKRYIRKFEYEDPMAWVDESESSDFSVEEQAEYSAKKISVDEENEASERLSEIVNHLYMCSENDCGGYKLSNKKIRNKLFKKEEAERVLESVSKSELEEGEELVMKVVLQRKFRCSIRNINGDQISKSGIEENPELIYFHDNTYLGMYGTPEKWGKNFSRKEINWNNGYGTMYYDHERVDEEIPKKIESDTKEYSTENDIPVFRKSSSEKENYDPDIEIKNGMLKEFFDNCSNRIKCLRSIDELNKEAKDIREYDEGEVIELAERGFKSERRFKKLPIFTLDLHGFRYENGISTAKEFVKIMSKYGVSRFNIVHGKSGSSMKKVAVKAVEKVKSKDPEAVEDIENLEGEINLKMNYEKDWESVNKDDRVYEIEPEKELVVINAVLYNGEGSFVKNQNMKDGEIKHRHPARDETTIFRFRELSRDMIP